MAKPTYILPNLEDWLKKFRYHTKIFVRFCETDISGHVNNTSYLIYFEQVRVEYLNRLNFFDGEMTGVTADIWCHYHAEAFCLEELQVSVRVAKMGNSSLDLEYAIIAAKDQRLVATGSGTIVVINKQTRQPTRIPDQIREVIDQFEYESLIQDK